MTKTAKPTTKSLNRRNMLQCMGWAGTGALFSFSGGVAASKTLDTALGMSVKPAKSNALSFVQISDTHIGFSKAANPDPLGTLRETISKVKALPQQPDFILHTGDITHLATAQQFDDAQMLLSELKLPIYYVPGEHDMTDGIDPRAYLERFGKGSVGEGWYSFDAGGTHFIALVNSIRLG
ncbi:MAG: metallophosphoesterase [Parasphingorhabdus sp.]|uniref:metallophosphoesterase family protein n=1 Tax=Parasphingorhabdus sp. TaxID=2709688 RepID=UPI00300269EA